VKSNNVRIQEVVRVTHELVRRCAGADWAGYDPYDALNSRVFQATPLRRSKWARLVFTQLTKRSIINFRPLLGVPKTHNPKGLALFLSAHVKLLRAGILEDSGQVVRLADLLLGLRAPSRSQSCWGYSFDWQTRSELVPRNSPNIICTTFAANALLDAYEAMGTLNYLNAAVEAARFIRDHLYSEEGGVGWFNYTPLEKLQIHNANLLGAALLCRTAAIFNDEDFVSRAMCATRFSVARQNPDGSWYYGERTNPSQKWIDNFHTGFNLSALQRVSDYASTNEFESSLKSGLNYYVTHFFERDGAPKYFHDRTYPIDIHSAAQGIITLMELKRLRPENVTLAFDVFSWAQHRMWDERGFFYYQKHRFFTNRIPYIRWGQAWMALALATLIEGDSNVRVDGRNTSVGVPAK